MLRKLCYFQLEYNKIILSGMRNISNFKNINIFCFTSAHCQIINVIMFYWNRATIWAILLLFKAMVFFATVKPHLIISSFHYLYKYYDILLSFDQRHNESMKQHHPSSMQSEIMTVFLSDIPDGGTLLNIMLLHCWCWACDIFVDAKFCRDIDDERVEDVFASL